MKLWAISDTHNRHEELIVPEDIDIVIHAGDAASIKDPYRNENELKSFLEWYSSLPIKHKIYIPGNHDTSLQARLLKEEQFPEIDTLIHRSIKIEDRVKIFGSPYQPQFGHNWAFNRKPNTLWKLWQDIPDDTDILVTHCPPKHILDLSKDKYNCGDLHLYNRIKEVQPKYHFFGHIHECGGQTLQDLKFGKTKFYNAAVMNLKCTEVQHNGFILNI